MLTNIQIYEYNKVFTNNQFLACTKINALLLNIRFLHKLEGN